MTLFCFQCAQSFRKGAALTAHGHATGHLIFCTFIGCTRGFTSQQALEQHINSRFHRRLQAKQLRDPTWQPHAPWVRTDTNSFASISDHEPSQSSALTVCHEAAYIPVSNADDYFPGDDIGGSFEAPNLSATYSVYGIHQDPYLFDKGKQPSQLDSLLQQESSGRALPPCETPEPLQSTSLYASSMPYKINDCYPIVTPHSCAKPLISPLVVDNGENDVGPTSSFLRSQQQTQPVSLGHFGSCKSCGFTFTSFESLESHFKYSIPGTPCTRLALERLLDSMRPSHEPVIPIDTGLQPVQNATRLNMQTLAA